MAELTDIRNSLKTVLNLLKMSETELNRPNEDVVTLSVCIGARQSLSTLMRIYLLSKSIDKNEDKSIDELLDQCKKVDADFINIDLSGILCKEMNTAECDGKYCLSHERVSVCLKIANQVKTIVLNKLSISESELD